MRLVRDLSPVRPALGLAIDEMLLLALRRNGCPAVRLWVDEAAVVVGRAQEVQDEVDLDAAMRHGTTVCRRMSGGGAVYHDPGNLNVSVIENAAALGGSVERVFQRVGGAIADGLRLLCAAIETSENGLFVGAAKIGGAAQARRGDAVLYHTTLLVRYPEIPPEEVLRAMRPGYCPTGVASRPRAMTSLDRVLDRDVSLAEAADAVWHGLATILGFSCDEDSLTAEESREAAQLAAAKYGEARWTFSR